MLKKVIRYTDYDGNPQEMEAYFNLTKTECMDLDLEYEEEGGLLEHLRKLFANKSSGEMPKKPAIDFIKLLVERSYGIRPEEDRTLFVKEDDNGRPLYKKFKQTPAYDSFVYSLLSGEESLDEFATKVMPYVPEAELEAAKERLKNEGLGDLLGKNNEKVIPADLNRG